MRHLQTLLQDGRVLLAGGVLGSGWSELTTSSLIYDPGTGLFTPTGSMSIARDNARAALLADGRVLLGRVAVAIGEERTIITRDKQTLHVKTSDILPKAETNSPAAKTSSSK